MHTPVLTFIGASNGRPGMVIGEQKLDVEQERDHKAGWLEINR